MMWNMRWAVIPVVLALSGPMVARADEPMTLEQLRKDVAPSGRVRNIKLERVSGWQTMHAFGWTLELEDAANPGVFQPADLAQDFRHGQRFRLRIEAATDLYIYVLVHNADDSHKVLLPDGPEKVPLVQAGQTTYLPATGAFLFCPPPGKERLRLLASPHVLPWVAPEKLWKLEDGHQLKVEEQNALAQLKSVRARSIDQAVERQGQMSRFDSITKAVKDIEGAKLARGAEVVAAEKVDSLHQVTYGSANPDARPVLVHDILLSHVE